MSQPSHSTDSLVAANSSAQWLIDSLLSPQPETAVDHFARWHSDHSTTARFYEKLIPLNRPGSGEQFAFEVDLDACSGCTACVTACHSLNGLDDGETWRAVGMLHGGSTSAPVVQHVTTACHHCIDPACLKGCPAEAYVKDPTTGIVRHLDDQCIGCQYCTLMCPYDVPTYSERLGIVRKCDMCSTRISAGQEPACVNACPNRAIRITIVNRDEVIENAEANDFVPGAPEPDCTLPTTIYRTSRSLPRNLLPADYHSAAPQHAHWPLIVMLLLTQASVGVFAVDWFVGWLPSLGSVQESTSALRPLIALGLGLSGLAASIFHLGRPLLAYRAVIGWRTSWLSREIVAFSLFAFAALAQVAVLCGVSPVQAGRARVDLVLGAITVASGLAGIVCSVMVYASTRRPFWNAPQTLARFLLTTLILGCHFCLLSTLFAMRDPTNPAWYALSRHLIAGLIASSAIKLLVDAAVFGSLAVRRHAPLKRTALLMTGALSRATKSRFAAGVVGGVLLPASALVVGAPQTRSDIAMLSIVVALSVVCSCIGEMCERFLFFAAVVAPKMPGTPSA